MSDLNTTTTEQAEQANAGMLADLKNETTEVQKTAPAPKKDKRPTAAESLAKQRAADAAAKAAKKATATANKTNPNKKTAKAGKKPAKAAKGKKAKKPTKTNPDAAPRGPKPKDASELRRPQLRILKALSDADASDAANGLTMTELVKKCKISGAVVIQGMGPIDPECRDGHNARTGYKCLLSRGMVKIGKDEERGTVYFLSGLGENNAEKITEKLPAKCKNMFSGK